MRSRHVLGALVLLTAGLGLAVACSNYEPPDVANYGPPNGLNPKTPNTPTSEDAGTPPPAGDSGAPTGDGGTVTAQLACQVAGGTLLPAAPCAVSWKTDIYPNTKSGAAWNCSSTSCHGNTTTPPNLTGADEHSIYVALANYTGTVTTGPGVGQPYINPCSTDPTKSEFVCNLLPAGTQCGLGSMPLATPIADAGIITTWVTCGAPEN